MFIEGVPLHGSTCSVAITLKYRKPICLLPMWGVKFAQNRGFTIGAFARSRPKF